MRRIFFFGCALTMIVSSAASVLGQAAGDAPYPLGDRSDAIQAAIENEVAAEIEPEARAIEAAEESAATTDASLQPNVAADASLNPSVAADRSLNPGMATDASLNSQAGAAATAVKAAVQGWRTDNMNNNWFYYMPDGSWMQFSNNSWRPVALEASAALSAAFKDAPNAGAQFLLANDAWWTLSNDNRWTYFRNGQWQPLGVSADASASVAAGRPYPLDANLRQNSAVGANAVARFNGPLRPTTPGAQFPADSQSNDVQASGAAANARAGNGALTASGASGVSSDMGAAAGNVDPSTSTFNSPASNSPRSGTAAIVTTPAGAPALAIPFNRRALNVAPRTVAPVDSAFGAANRSGLPGSNFNTRPQATTTRAEFNASGAADSAAAAVASPAASNQIVPGNVNTRPGSRTSLFGRHSASAPLQPSTGENVPSGPNSAGAGASGAAAGGAASGGGAAAGGATTGGAAASGTATGGGASAAGSN